PIFNPAFSGYSGISNQGGNYGLYVIAENGASNFGIYAETPNGINDFAGYFQGKVVVTDLLNAQNGIDVNGEIEANSIDVVSIETGTITANGLIDAQNDIVVNGLIETSSQGIKFEDQSVIKKVIPLKYIICAFGNYPPPPGPFGTNASNNTLVGEVRLYAGNWAPNGWLECEGQLLLVTDYPILFDIIGDTYGGNGVSNFRLPDLREAVASHQ
ncbi:MAG: phage tail protein, partial [Bacteroidota bacterium]